jgi:RND family efflux transporter MFP subunit
MRQAFLVVAGFSTAVVAAGCEHGPADSSAGAPPVVMVSTPLFKEVTDFQDFTGRTASPQTVNIRCRVSGYLDQVLIRPGDEPLKPGEVKEGGMVEEKQLLFVIDPREYEAQLNRAQTRLVQAKAQSNFDEADYKRNVALRKTGAVTQEDLDKSLAARDTSAAAVDSAKADIRVAELNVEYTSVTSPIAGRVGRALVTKGNLILAGETNGATLTTVVQYDPMYAYFDVDERTVLTIQEMIRQGKIKSARENSDVPVFLQLATQRNFPHKGTINFVDNQIKSGTGTIQVRGVFSNKDSVLSPGLFVRVRINLGEPHKTLLVAERALQSDQGQRFLFVVNDKNEVVFRPVKVGQLHERLRVIEAGLEPTDRVIVDGMLRVRPGVVVDPKLTHMPTGPAAEGEAPADPEPTKS